MPSNSSFTVAGMGSSTSASSHHSHGAPWGSTSTGGTLGTSLSDSFTQSRTHYQSGYMMVSLHFSGQACRLTQCQQPSVQNNVSGSGNSDASSVNVQRFCMQTLPQGSQRTDEVPIVQTKAKLNNALSRGAASDFGMESMFEKSRLVIQFFVNSTLHSTLPYSRQRQKLADEDAPPTNSIYDIPNESYADSNSARFQRRVISLYTVMKLR